MISGDIPWSGTSCPRTGKYPEEMNRSIVEWFQRIPE